MGERAGRRLPQRGQILVGIVILILALVIMIPALVDWVRQESRISVKDQKSTTAFNLAEAAVDRGVWKLKSSSATWESMKGGVVIAGYNFDVTYGDVAGGTYRVQMGSGTQNGAQVVTVWGEGRDSMRRETRSIKAVYQVTSMPAAILSGGTLNLSGQAIVHWGPIMAMNDIVITNPSSSFSHHYPRKLSQQVVRSSPAGNYDTSGITPPNTDNLEWWSDFAVPELPIIDFDKLKNQAIANGTYNCNGTLSANGGQGMMNMMQDHGGPMGLLTCNSPCGNTTCTVGNIFQDNRYNANYVWYWDNNVVMNNPGVKGTMIVRGNLTTNNGDWYGPYGPLNNDVTMNMPYNAWAEYQKLDNTTKNQYPGDLGLKNSANSYVLGDCSSTCEGSASGEDMGFYGFIYVGRNANFQGNADIYGAVWVAGNWSAAGDNLLFYNAQLDIPLLNVILIRLSWNEATPSPQAWQ